MAQYHLKKIICGVVFICLGFAVLFSAFYFFGDEISFLNPARNTDIDAAELQPPAALAAQASLSPPPAGDHIQAAASAPTDNSIEISSLVKTSEKVYDEAEKARKEGLMWVDHDAQKYFVTLGAIHGLDTGDYLTVYDGDQRIGRVEVDSVFDVISYVLPFKNTDNFYQENYYHVIIE